MAVRNESVRLSLEGNFTSEMARAAVVTGLLSKELKGLDGTKVLGDLDRDAEKAAKSTDKFAKSTEKATESSDALGKSSRNTSAEVDRFSGRLRLLADTAAIIGPAFVPITAIAVPAIAGMAAEFGAAALAGGTALLAFQGVGDTLKAVNTAALEPTTENLEAARVAMDQLSPAAQGFVEELLKLEPTLKALQGSAAAGLFPGLGDALDQLSTAAPQVERVLGSIGTVLGNLAKEGAAALTGPGFAGFFDYVEHDAPVALAQLGTAVGHVTHALAELVQGTAPLQHGFGDWMVEAARSFDQFATGLSKTQGFQEFVDYVRQNGPLVAHAVAAIGNALLQVVEAGAPLGGPVLQSLTAVADVIAKLADSNAGPAILATVTALSLLNRTQSAFGAIAESSFIKAARGQSGLVAQVDALRTGATRGGLALAGLGVAASGLGDHFRFANTATLGLTGSIAGPWGAAVGAGVGLLLDFAGGQQKAITDTETLTSTLNQQTGAITQNTAAYVAKQFADNGVLDAASKLGVSLSDVTAAALGNDDALARVNDRVAALKEQLSQPVAGRSVQDADKAADAYGKLADAGDTVTGAIGQTNGALTKGQGRLSQIAQATQGAAGSFDAAATAAETFTAQIDHLNNALSRRASLRDYQAAIDDFAKALKTNGQTLDVTTEKGRANQAALDNIASTAAKVAQSLHGADRGDFLVNARKAFVDAADKAGLTRAAAQRLADQIHLTGQAKATPTIGLNLAAFVAGSQNVSAGLAKLTGQSANPKVNVDAGNALSVIHQVESSLFGLRDKTITLTTNHVVHNIGSTGNPQAHAAGGFIRGPGITVPPYLQESA